MPTGGEIRGHHVIADSEPSHAGADGHDVADKFMPDYSAAVQAGKVAGDHVQIGSADSSEGDLDEDILGIDKSRRRRLA
jgi:hypothetical protein